MAKITNTTIMKTKTSLLCGLVAVLVLWSACNGSKEQDNRGLFPLKDYTELQAEEVFPDLIMKTPVKMLIIGDKLLIAQFRQDSLIQVVDLGMKEEPYMIAPKGAGPHDFYDIQNMLYLSEDSLLAIYDMNYRKYTYYNIKDSHIYLNDMNFAESDYLRTKEGNCHPVPFGDYYILSMADEGKVLTLNDKELKVVEYFGDYPGSYPGEMDFDPKKTTSFTFSDSELFKLSHYQQIISNPQQDRVVVAGLWSDWLAFFKKGGKAMEQTAAYYSYDTFTKVSDDPFNTGSKGGALGPKHSKKTIASYQDLYATEDYFYALYYGFPELDKDNPAHTCYILQFSWDGDFLKAYHLQEVISHFAVDEEQNCIYATYTAKGEDPVLLKYDLK